MNNYNPKCEMQFAMATFSVVGNSCRVYIIGQDGIQVTKWYNLESCREINELFHFAFCFNSNIFLYLKAADIIT